MRWALYVTLSPVWFDPGEFQGLTPFWVLYAIHDALVKPMPGNLMTPSLAESWTVSADQLVYEFKLREGLQVPQWRPFHGRGREVQLSSRQGIEDSPRQGAGHRDRRSVPSPLSAARALAGLHDLLWHARQRQRAGWCPRSTSSGSATMASRSTPIGLGPYKFVSHTPGVELIMEANEGYWRKTPSVKRLVFKSVPESTTRAGHAEAGRRRHRVPARRSPGERGEAGSRAAAGLLRWHRHLLPGFPRPVGPEIALGRPSGAAGRELRDRPSNAVRGGDGREPRSPREASSRAPSSSRCPSSPIPTTRRRPDSCSPRPAIPTGSMLASCIKRRRTSRWARRS